MLIIEKLRLLPTLLIAAVFLLVLKLGSIGYQADVILSGVSAARAEQGVLPGPAAAADMPKAEAAPAPAAASATAASAAAKAEPQAGTPVASVEPPASSDGPVDISAMSKGEVRLLEGLAERRGQLDDRTRDMDMREKLLVAAEGRIDSKIVELKALRAQIDLLLKEHDAHETAQITSLVKVYENMKPKDAARIFDGLEMPILIAVAEHMKEVKMAPVLAEMSPPMAKALTVELATHRRLPAKGG
jgi:flagellar motility protein MotE (MotC chaperone)